MFPKGTDTSVQTGPQVTSLETFVEQGRDKCVTKMVVVEHGADRLLCVARKNCVIELYNMKDQYELVHSWDNYKTSAKRDDPEIVGLDNLEGKIVSCNSEGLVVIYDLTTHQVKELALEKSPLSVFKASPFTAGLFAFGGNNVDLEIIKIDLQEAKLEKVWQAKNVKNDRLDLQVPIWINNLLFLESNENHVRLVTVTHFGQIRTYDTLKSRRPQSDTKISLYSIEGLVAGNQINEIIYSDVHTTTATFDYKMQKSLGKFVGATGAAQDLDNFSNNLLATGGLDRYLRVFDLETRTTVGKVFVGTQISAVLVLEDDEDPNEKRKAEDELEQDQLWREIEERGKKNFKKGKR